MDNKSNLTQKNCNKMCKWEHASHLMYRTYFQFSNDMQIIQFKQAMISLQGMAVNIFVELTK